MEMTKGMSLEEFIELLGIVNNTNEFSEHKLKFLYVTPLYDVRVNEIFSVKFGGELNKNKTEVTISIIKEDKDNTLNLLERCKYFVLTGEVLSTKLLSPDEYIIYSVNLFPSLYSSPSYDETKFKVLDRVFNTIGNGIDKSSFYSDKEITEQERANATNLWNCEETPNRYKWTCKANKGPYPNFKKQYSLVWKEDFNMSKEWIDSGVWFYKRCEEYILNSKYEDEEPTRNVKGLFKFLKGYSSNKEISDIYNCLFIGNSECFEDVRLFDIKRWNKENRRRLSFIEETITRLKSIK